MKITFVTDDGPETADIGKKGARARTTQVDLRDRMPDPDRRRKATPEGDALNPTRYLDWEKNGQCVDF